MRRVRVDRSRTPDQVVAETGRKQYIEPEMVANMPRGEGEWVNVHFFTPDASSYDDGDRLSDESLEREYEKHGLKPVDFYSLVEVADEEPIATHWMDQDGNWCHAAFVDVGGELRVHVNRSTRGWSNFWKKFAGLPK